MIATPTGIGDQFIIETPSKRTLWKTIQRKVNNHKLGSDADSNLYGYKED